MENVWEVLTHSRDKLSDFHVWLVHCKAVTGNCYELFWLIGSVVLNTAIKFVHLYCAGVICMCVILLKKFDRSWWFHNIYYTILFCLSIIHEDLCGDDDFRILKSRLSPDSFVVLQDDAKWSYIIWKILFLQELITYMFHFDWIW